MPTKRTPKARAHRAPIKITDDMVDLYRSIIDMYDGMQRDKLISDDGFLNGTAKLDAAFPQIETMIISTFGRDVPPDYENNVDDWLRAHAIRLQLDKAANIEWT